MYLVILDSEQAAIVRHSLAAARGFMTARLERADPDQIISKSLKLQDIKTEHIERQLSATYMERQGALADELLDLIPELTTAMATATTRRQKEQHARRLIDVVVTAFRGSQANG